jgi:hypothetical protein
MLEGRLATSANASDLGKRLAGLSNGDVRSPPLCEVSFQPNANRELSMLDSELRLQVISGTGAKARSTFVRKRPSNGTSLTGETRSVRGSTSLNSRGDRRRRRRRRRSGGVPLYRTRGGWVHCVRKMDGWIC